MEGHINARQQNRCEATLKFKMSYVFLLVQHSLMARFNDVSEDFFDPLNGVSFSQLDEWFIKPAAPKSGKGSVGLCNLTHVDGLCNMGVPLNRCIVCIKSSPAV